MHWLGVPGVHAEAFGPQALTATEHTPAMHLSTEEQVLPSSQSLPSATGAFLQSPLARSHCPVLQASFWPLQSFAVPPQLPAAQVSLFVQGLPSSHGFVLFGFLQPLMGSQLS